MKRRGLSLVLGVALACAAASAQEPAPAFKALALYSTNVESDHIGFAKVALSFFQKLAVEKHFVFDSSTDWESQSLERLKQYQVVLWLDDSPHSPAQKQAFEQYMTQGGGWLGFHVAAYNDRYTKWPWFLNFVGNGVFHSNNWPPQPALIRIDDTNHPVTRALPASYRAPRNEWYLWEPSPRSNPKVKVLATLDPSNYPLGKKDILTQGDLPVVWMNTDYRMIYMNMGHCAEVLGDPIQDRFIADALIWLGNGGK